MKARSVGKSKAATATHTKLPHAGETPVEEGQPGPLVDAYRRGARVHERARRTARDGRKVKKSDLYQAVARDVGVSPSQVARDAKFAAAVDTIVKHCGKRARAVLLDRRHQLTAKQVERLSRKAPPMQRAQIASLATGGRLQTWRSYSDLAREMYPDVVEEGGRKPPPARQVADLPPVETWDFAEVVNRLKRAGGLVAKNVLDVPRLEEPLLPDLRAQLLRDLDFLLHCGQLLRQLMRS